MMARLTQPWQLTLLAAVVLVVFGNSLDGSFQYDDFHSIVRNTAVRDAGNLPAFLTDPSLFSADPEKSMYRPVLLASFALNHAVHGYDVFGYHAVNVVLHLMCVLLLWRLARRMATPGAALTMSLLFAVHPLVTEPVNYISSRSELLLAMFFLGTLWAHARAHEAPGRSRRLLAVPVLCCLLALLSKATAVMLLPVLLLFDLIALGWRPQSATDLLRRHGLYWALGAGYIAVIVANGFLGGSLAAPVRGMVAQVLTQSKALIWYLRLLAVPRPLSVEHAFSESLSINAEAIAGAAVMLSLLWLAGRNWRRLPLPVLGLLMAAFVLLPTTVMPLNVLVNERRLYLVLAALCLALAALARVRRVIPVGVGIVLACLTMQRNDAWATQTSLWEAARRDGSSSYRTWVNLGKAYHEEGDVDRAQAAYEAALQLDDRHGDVYNNLAVLLHQSGRAAEAVPWYQQALARYPGMDEIYQNLADAHSQLGHHEAAVRVYQEALKVAPDNGAAWNNLGQTHMVRRQFARAALAFARAAELLPRQHEPLNNLGNALDAQGQSSEAMAAYREALMLAPDAGPRGTIYANLGETLRRTGSYEMAVVMLDSALQLAPTAVACDYRGRVAFDTGQLGEAQKFWARAVDMDPNLGSAWTGLGEVALQTGEHTGAIAALRRAVHAGAGVRAWWGLARSLAVGPDTSATRAACERVIALSASDDARSLAAQRWLQQGGRL